MFRYIIVTTCFIIISFILGWVTASKKVIIKKEEVKVYDLTQSPEVIAGYASMMDKILIDKDELENKEKEIEFKKHRIWQEGFQSGYLERAKDLNVR